MYKHLTEFANYSLLSKSSPSGFYGIYLRSVARYRSRHGGSVPSRVGGRESLGIYAPRRGGFQVATLRGEGEFENIACLR